MCEKSVGTTAMGLGMSKCTPDGVAEYQGVVHFPTSDVQCRPAPCYSNCHRGNRQFPYQI